MAADGKFYRFSTKETYVYSLTEDNSSSTTGPTYGSGKQVIGIQSISFTLNASQEQLPGDDVILGVEASDDAVEISCEYSKIHHDALVVLKGGAVVADGTTSNWGYYPGDTTVYFKLQTRVTKIGKPGGDNVLTFYKVSAGSIEFGVENKAFRTNSFSAQALPIDSTISFGGSDRHLVLNDLERATAASIAPSNDTTAPTISARSPADADTGVAVDANIVWTLSEELDPNYVTTDSVVVQTATGTMIAGTVTLVNNGASTTITFNPTSNLGAATAHVATLLSTVRDTAGNRLAANDTINFTTA